MNKLTKETKEEIEKVFDDHDKENKGSIEIK